MIKKVSLDDLQKTRDIGPIVAKSIYDWFREPRNLRLLERLKSVGVRIKNQILNVKGQVLVGKTFVLTGQLESMSRDQAKEKIRALGGDVSESVSKKTSFVVVGSESGSKLEKAKNLEVNTLTEEEFLKIIR